jgi:hypothetical protein
MCEWHLARSLALALALHQWIDAYPESIEERKYEELQ